MNPILPTNTTDASATPDVFRIVVPAAAAAGRDARRAWREASVAARGADRVVLDVSGVSRLDRRGVAGLLDCVARLRAGGAEVALGGVQPSLWSLLELLRLTEVVALHAADAGAAEGAHADLASSDADGDPTATDRPAEVMP